MKASLDKTPPTKPKDEKADPKDIKHEAEAYTINTIVVVDEHGKEFKRTDLKIAGDKCNSNLFRLPYNQSCQ